MAGVPPDNSSDRDRERLCKLERDLELAAQIGQSLLEQNKELQSRNEFLEEGLATGAETIVQLNHELQKRIDLLRVYSYYEDNDDRSNDDSSLRQRIERLQRENKQLQQEKSSLLKDVDATSEQSREHITELVRQLDAANDKIGSLQVSNQQKSEQYVQQAQSIEKLLQEIAVRHGRERQLSNENEELLRQLDDAVARQNDLVGEMQYLQTEYAELKSTFVDAEDELRKFRQGVPNYRSQSMDSLYDSLASELENSDSGLSVTPATSARFRNNLHLELQKFTNSSEEVEVPSAAFNEVNRRKFVTAIGQAPTHTPESQGSPVKTLVETPTPQVARKSVACDASTSTSCDGVVPTVDQPVEPLKLDKHQRYISDGQSLIFRPCCHSPQKPKRELTSWPSITEKKLKKTSSSDSLEDYVAPKMGEPGVPGTRDLDFSLKVLKARRQVELDFAQFRQRKGLEPSHFFSSQEPLAVTTKTVQDRIDTDFSVTYGLERHMSIVSPKPSVCGAIRAMSIDGVITRASLSPSQVSPKHSASVAGPSSPVFPSGLASLSTGSATPLAIFSSNGILKRL